MSNAILFGAGASKGSHDVRPHCPPLGSELFTELRESYPKVWGQLSQEEEVLFLGEDMGFEDGMGELWDADDPRTTALIRAKAHYFTKFRPGPRNTYTELVRRLQEAGELERTVFFSLNYDCLLSYALRDAGYQVAYVPGEAGPNQVPVIKPHGSCNFLPNGVSGDARAVSFTPRQVSWETGIRFESCSRAAKWISDNAFYPAMAIYMEGKPVNSCGSVLEAMQAAWADTVRDASTIGVIGVGMNRDDDHIFAPLAETDASLVVVGGEGGFSRWADDVGQGELEFPGDRGRFTPDLDAFVDAFVESP